MGEALRGDVEARRRGRGPGAKRLALVARLALLLVATPAARAQSDAEQHEAQRLDRARFTVVAFPKDLPLARTLLDEAVRDDSFPGLPRPQARALIAIAPDA